MADAVERVSAVWKRFSTRYPGWRNRVLPGMISPLVRMEWWLPDSEGEEPVLESVADVIEAFEAAEPWHRPEVGVRELVRDLREAVAAHHV